MPNILRLLHAPDQIFTGQRCRCQVCGAYSGILVVFWECRPAVLHVPLSSTKHSQEMWPWYNPFAILGGLLVILLDCGSYKYLQPAFWNLPSSFLHSQDIPYRQPQLKPCFSGLPSSLRPWPWSGLPQHRPWAHSPAQKYSQLSGTFSIPQIPACPTL